MKGGYFIFVKKNKWRWKDYFSLSIRTTTNQYNSVDKSLDYLLLWNQQREKQTRTIENLTIFYSTPYPQTTHSILAYTAEGRNTIEVLNNNTSIHRNLFSFILYWKYIYYFCKRNKREKIYYFSLLSIRTTMKISDL